MTKPKIAVIGTGGTIASIGTGPFDILDYGANQTMISGSEIIAKFPAVHDVAEVIAVDFKSVPSPDMGFTEWKALVGLMDELTGSTPGLDGFVILHGTASMEETAYFLSLTLKTPLPVVITGAQRPASGLSTDAAMNLANAARVAGSPEARGMGVMLMLNDEIHAAREVTKTSTFRLQTFRTPDFGALGHADGDAVVFYRKPIRKAYPETEFDIREMESLPRVDIVYAYTGSDGTASRAFIEAGAKVVISAGFAPGFAGRADFEVLSQAVAERGLVAMQCTRAGSGRTFKGKRLREHGWLIADNLNPQKARLLLMLALAHTDDTAEIERMFLTY